MGQEKCHVFFIILEVYFARDSIWTTLQYTWMSAITCAITITWMSAITCTISPFDLYS